MVNINMKKYIITIIIFLFSVSYTDAAVLSFGTDLNTFETGVKVPVDILLDTEGESINSIDLDVDFSNEVEFVGYDSKLSLIPLWISIPKISSPNVVNFSGVIPGGIDRTYDAENPNEKSLKIVRLFFIPKSTGVANFDISKAIVLKNDGLGTSVNTKSIPKKITIKKGVETKNIDNQPPLPFVVTIVKKSIFAKTPRLAVFDAEDIDSGIKNYEISINGSKPKVAISPYPLPYQLFSYTLSVTAYDYFGNSIEQKITVPGEETNGIVTISILALVFMVIYRYKKKSL